MMMIQETLLAATSLLMMGGYGVAAVRDPVGKMVTVRPPRHWRRRADAEIPYVRDETDEWLDSLRTEPLEDRWSPTGDVMRADRGKALHSSVIWPGCRPVWCSHEHLSVETALSCSRTEASRRNRLETTREQRTEESVRGQAAAMTAQFAMAGGRELWEDATVIVPPPSAVIAPATDPETELLQRFERLIGEPEPPSMTQRVSQLTRSDLDQWEASLPW
jgi:hypothetical protein